MWDQGSRGHGIKTGIRMVESVIFLRHQGSGRNIFVDQKQKRVKDQKFVCKNRISDEINIPLYEPERAF